jgi:hypothetical protein
VTTNDFKFRLIETSSGKYVTYANDGTYKVNGAQGDATIFNVFNNPAVYNNSLGGIALQTYGGPNANKQYARHAGYTLWSNGFGGNNYDFAWQFKPTGAPNQYIIGNWFPGVNPPTWFLDNSNGILRITQNSGKTWTVEPA